MAKDGVWETKQWGERRAARKGDGKQRTWFDNAASIQLLRMLPPFPLHSPSRFSSLFHFTPPLDPPLGLCSFLRVCATGTTTNTVLAVHFARSSGSPVGFVPILERESPINSWTLGYFRRVGHTKIFQARNGLLRSFRIRYDFYSPSFSTVASRALLSGSNP